MNRPRLINSSTSEVFPIGIGETTMGRSSSCKIVIKDAKASGLHATITCDPAGQFIIRDSGSKNGTFVNGVKTAEAHLSAADSVRIGGEHFVFEVPESPLEGVRPDDCGSADESTISTKIPSGAEGAFHSAHATCSECHIAIPQGATVCRNCGAPISAEPPTILPQAEINPSPTSEAAEASGGSISTTEPGATSSLPPSLPKTTPPFDRSETGAAAQEAGTNSPTSPSNVPPLPIGPSALIRGIGKGIWHPVAVTLVGIPLGFLFASVLIALNWHVLKRRWWAVFAWSFAIFYVALVQRPLVELFSWPWPYVIGVVVWFPVAALPQLQYLRKHILRPYPRRSWVMALGLGIAAQAFLSLWMHYDQAHGKSASVPATSVAGSTDYTAEQLAAAYGPCVEEVQTRWKETSWIFFLSDKGGDGSAVLLRATPGKLYFVTNRHVVEAPAGAQQYVCKIHVGDGHDYAPVEILAYGKNGLDLALLRLGAPDMNETFEMPLASVKSITPGQQCVAIGNALGYGRSTTSGIVSRFDHIGNEVRIRTSAPISPGNSGGGLFSNKGGFLIGITTAILTGENAQNLNSVIPADYFAGDDVWDYLPGMSR